jgi:natural product biosynthesis luciferase-like monooxygenase protein
MLADSRVSLVLTVQALQQRVPQASAELLCLDTQSGELSALSTENPSIAVQPENLAYVIYTSGSTGVPKGVMIEHRNVVNFCLGMDQVFGDGAAREPAEEEHGAGQESQQRQDTQQESREVSSAPTWLALTSISFDISVLELLWTLARGFRLLLHGETRPALPPVALSAEDASFVSDSADSAVSSTASTKLLPARSTHPIHFSLFYFSSDDSLPGPHRYRLLLDGARFADAHGFSAVWTPERHFHAFGGLYPNPSLTSAALATITERVSLRAGSVVLPLHQSLRVAEEWSVVDNLSNGRVAISFASGWHADDFVLAPQQYEHRHQSMREQISVVRRLWRGEAVRMRSGSGKEVSVQVQPRAVQAQLPVWVTAAGSPETFRLAGQLRAGLLTHLLGQSIEELREKIAIYRRAWQEAAAEEVEEGEAREAEQRWPGGYVSLMLHTYVGERDEEVRRRVAKPLQEYLRSSVDLLRKYGQSLGYEMAGKDISRDDLEAVLEYAFERYYETSGLMGSVESCEARMRELDEVGVDEVACLIDFGVGEEEALEGLKWLKELKDREERRWREEKEREEERGRGREEWSIGEQIEKYEVTHLQCTPSLARMMSLEQGSFQSLAKVQCLLVGGEELPRSLARQLGGVLRGDLYNMYGPTETTIWSSVEKIESDADEIRIGKPIANTQMYILDAAHRLLPVGAYGELYIGGAGVVRGYMNRPELTAERFVPDPYSGQPGARMYRTGDIARFSNSGSIEYVGRVDQQVKVRGYRVELGEIEAVLEQHEQVREAVVVVRENETAEKRLVAYVVRSSVGVDEAGGTTASDNGASGGASDEAKGESAGSRQWQLWLRERLPEYMVPAIFVQMQQLPLTPNGKIDRQALPAPGGDAFSSEESYTAPQTAVEKMLAGVWSQLLGLDKVGTHDDFFHIGGHSLLATRMISQLRDILQIEIPLRSLFEERTIARLAPVVERYLAASEGSEQVMALIEQLSEISEDEAFSLLNQPGRLSQDLELT